MDFYYILILCWCLSAFFYTTTRDSWSVMNVRCNVLICYECTLQCLASHTSLISFHRLSIIIINLLLVIKCQSHLLEHGERTLSQVYLHELSPQVPGEILNLECLVRVCSVLHYDPLVYNSGESRRKINMWEYCWQI